MLSVARVFYAYDLLSPLVYLTGDEPELVFVSIKITAKDIIVYPRYVKKYCKKT